MDLRLLVWWPSRHNCRECLDQIGSLRIQTPEVLMVKNDADTSLFMNPKDVSC